MSKNPLIALDREIFSLINNNLTNDILDFILILWRNEFVWLPLYIFIISFIILNFKKKSYWYLFFIILTISLTDITSSRIIKPLVERPRPCHEESGIEDIRVLVPCGSGYSFTSSHATNHFGIAFFLIFTFGRRRKYVFLPLVLWALLVAYAQVYVGVHYPIDVLTGSLLGIGIALFTSESYKFLMKKMNLSQVRL